MSKSMTKWRWVEYLAILLIITGASWTRKVVFLPWQIPVLIAYALVLVPVIMFLCGLRFEQYGKLYLFPFVVYPIVMIFSYCFWVIYHIYQGGYQNFYRDLVAKHGICPVAWQLLSSRLAGMAIQFGICAFAFLLGYGFTKWREKKAKDSRRIRGFVSQ